MSQIRRKPRNAGGTESQSQKSCANPLFEQWLIEWKEDAVQKNSKMQYVFAKALVSLRKYPLKLSSGRDCLLLEYFGTAICRMIDARLSKENIVLVSSSQTSYQESDEVAVVAADIIETASLAAANKKPNKRRKNEKCAENIELISKKTKGSKGYIPPYRSGGYALLVTLLQKEETPSYRGYMLKSELQREAQIYCDSSFTRSENPGRSSYTAWNTMSTLCSKNLVIRQGNPVKFLLTIEGRELAKKLLSADGKDQNFAQDGSQSQESSAASTDDEGLEIVDFHRVTLEPGRFEIILCVDTGETNAKGKKEEVIGELQKNGVNLEVMRLSVGDFVWIIRETSPVGGNRRLTISRAHDMVLPFIVERKRADDFASSIKDGRFHEQKHRLQKTGLKPIYLMEAYGSGDWGLADGTIFQALANTQITNEFLVQETASIKETCGYLTHMTRHLSNIYGTKKISNCTKEEWPSLKNSSTNTYLMSFSDFNEFGIKLKNWTVTEMFARQLMRLRGLSVDRAYAIIQKYPTLQSILREYRSCENEKERDLLLANIFYGTSGKTVGPAISKALSKLYNTRSLTS